MGNLGFVLPYNCLQAKIFGYLVGAPELLNPGLPKA